MIYTTQYSIIYVQINQMLSIKFDFFKMNIDYLIIAYWKVILQFL